MRKSIITARIPLDRRENHGYWQPVHTLYAVKYVWLPYQRWEYKEYGETWEDGVLISKWVRYC